MTTEDSKESGFSRSSFIDVGIALNDTPNLGLDNEQTSSRQPFEYKGLSADKDDNKEGTLIVGEGDDKHSVSISEVSLHTFDVDAVTDMGESIRKKNRIIALLLFGFTGLGCIVQHTVIKAKAREQALELQLDRLNKELNSLKFDQAMKNLDSTLFEVDNCYFNFKASGALGACADDATRSANEWYDWGVDTLYSLLETTPEDEKEDDSDGELNASDILTNMYNDWVENFSVLFNQQWDDISILEEGIDE